MEPRVRLVEYEIRTEDGALVDASTPERPLELVPGDGRLLPMVELAALRCAPGESEELVLPPEQACGARDESKVRRLPLSGFPEGLRPAAGVHYVARDAAGATAGFTVRALEGDEAVCDFNHPLAGKTLRVRVRVLGVLPPR